MPLSAGTRFGPYEILSAVGAGGMGEVYLAQDTRLGRKVALKILRSDFVGDESLKARFIKEARAASALNHPNIIALYDIISENHTDVIVMEYVEGESLRTLISRGAMETKRALEIVAQVSSALAAAHRAGIIHRDIKPENIIVSRDNRTKVLDFGLAKLTDIEASSLKSQLTTAAEFKQIETKSGIILGTTFYMSPEQARGDEIDGRTDIFSLGVVLYEMLTGVRPFGGKSTIDTLHAIINQNPEPVLQRNPALPMEANEIVEKAIAKNPSERYQHAGDLELDSRRLKRALETNSLSSTKVSAARRAQKKSTPMLWLSVTLLVAAIALNLWQFVSSRNRVLPQTPLIERMSLSPLTVDIGYQGNPTFSPDGETIAYVSDRTGDFEIFLKQISGGPDINITNNPADDVQPSFSPDGKQIAFVSTRGSKTGLHYPGPDAPLVGGDIWITPTFGGSAKRIVPSANFPSWSPDGNSILYSGGPWFGQNLFKISSIGGNTHKIPFQLKGNTMFPRLDFPKYSPDGRWITFQAGNTIYLIKATGGDAGEIAKGSYPAWNGKNHLIYTSEEPGKNFALVQVEISDQTGKATGTPEMLTFGPGRQTEAAVSPGGKRIAFVSLMASFNVEVIPFDAESGRTLGEPQRLTKGSEIAYFHNFSPDGRSVVYESRRGVSSRIWKLIPGSSAIQLTSDPNFDDYYPRYSPDGTTIAFIRNQANSPVPARQIWLMAEDGANLRPLNLPVGRSFLSWMPDGAGMIYASTDSQLHLYDLASGKDKRITDEELVAPVTAVTPDGKTILYQSSLSGNVEIRGIPASGGKARNIFASERSDYHPFVSPSGKWLYVQADHKNLYRVPGPKQDWLKKEPEKVTDFPESGLYIEDPQFSRDGKQLLYSRGNITGNIWVLTLNKK